MSGICAVTMGFQCRAPGAIQNLLGGDIYLRDRSAGRSLVYYTLWSYAERTINFGLSGCSMWCMFSPPALLQPTFYFISSCCYDNQLIFEDFRLWFLIAFFGLYLRFLLKILSLQNRSQCYSAEEWTCIFLFSECVGYFQPFQDYSVKGE